MLIVVVTRAAENSIYDFLRWRRPEMLEPARRCSGTTFLWLAFDGKFQRQ